MSEELQGGKKPQKKTGLGRGLGSLLGAELSDRTGGFEESAKPSAPAVTSAAAPQVIPAAKPTPVAAVEYMKIPIEKLVPNKEQPRKKFSAEELAELAKSIKQKGLLQPILVKPEGAEFQIIAGERRWRASQLAGLKHIPVILKNALPQEVLELALIENIQRHDLNAIEEAEAYAVLAEKYSLTQQEIADRVGKERATVANIMRILALPREVRDMVKEGQLQLGHAKALLALPTAEAQVALAKKAAKLSLSVRALEKLVKSALSNTAEKADEIELEDANLNMTLIKTLAGELQRSLGTRVQIDFNGGKGKLEVAFYSVDELNRIADRLRR